MQLLNVNIETVSKTRVHLVVVTLPSLVITAGLFRGSISTLKIKPLLMAEFATYFNRKLLKKMNICFV